MTFVEHLPDTLYVGPGDDSRPDFTVQRLGPCRYESPALKRDGAHAVVFVDDGDRVVFDPRIRSLEHYNQQSASPPAMEIGGPRRDLYFDPASTKAAIVTCGGLCPGINNVIRGIVLELYHYYGVANVVGVRYGYQGLTLDASLPQPVPLTLEGVKSIHRDGGTVLGTSRGGLDPARAVEFLDTRGIDILFTIGGDGTQKGAAAIATEIARQGLSIAVIGIPKTIDNDIAYVDRTFGFETAVARAQEVLDGAHQEAQAAENGIGLVKLMGRHAGFIAAQAALASGDANFILIPEVSLALEGEHGFLGALDRRLDERDHALIVVAEGAGQSMLQDAASGEAARDASGNLRLGDVGIFLKDAVCQHLEQRHVRYTLKYIDPSYYIRSVRANAADSIFCVRLAQDAVHAAMAGRTDMLVGRWNNVFTHVPLLTAVTRRKTLNPQGALWRAVREASGQRF